MILKLAFKSLKNRYGTSLLTVISIAIGISLFLGIERVRLGLRESFSGAISQTDLIVGARGGNLPLLLYSVFHIGNATNNISYSSYEKLKKHPAVDWTIPYSLGDSHRGFRVVATNENFFKHYRFRGEGSIQFSSGDATAKTWDVVLGAEVAKALKYKVGDEVVLSHGLSSEGADFLTHEDKPFRIIGILKPTATPIDRSLYITLEGMEALHVDWNDGGAPVVGKEISAERVEKLKLKITHLTAFFVRTKSRVDALYLQREINTFSGEPLMAIIPGVALSELWNSMTYAEDALRIVSVFVILASFLGMLVSLLTSLNERRREIAVFRSVGVGASKIITLLVAEALLLTLGGILGGVAIVFIGLTLSQNYIQDYFGFYIPVKPLEAKEYAYLGIVLGVSVVLGLIPAIKAYQKSLADGLSLYV